MVQDVLFLIVCVVPVALLILHKTREDGKQVQGTLSGPRAAFKEPPGYFCRPSYEQDFKCFEYTVSFAMEYSTPFKAQLMVPPLVKRERLAAFSDELADRLLRSYFCFPAGKALPWPRASAEQIAELFSGVAACGGTLEYRNGMLVCKAIRSCEHTVDDSLALIRRTLLEVVALLEPA